MYFIGSIQVLSGRTTVTLKKSAFVAYLVHVELLNCSAKYCAQAVEQVHIAVCLLSEKENSDLKKGCSTVDHWSSVYYATGPCEVLVEEDYTAAFFTD